MKAAGSGARFFLSHGTPDRRFPSAYPEDGDSSRLEVAASRALPQSQVHPFGSQQNPFSRKLNAGRLS